MGSLAFVKIHAPNLQKYQILLSTHEAKTNFFVEKNVFEKTSSLLHTLHNNWF